MTYAIIDLGTNTCNLLIAEPDKKNRFRVLFNDKYAVKLGKDGINKKLLTKEAMKRGVEAISKCKKTAVEHKAEKIYAFATSALRTANNSAKLVKTIKKKCGLNLEIISGEREAELIYKGIKQSVEFWNEKVLIVDIGGGSNELIIANHYDIFWKKSYPIGMARVLEKFEPYDPISPRQVEDIDRFFKEELSDFQKIYKHHQPRILIGASGSFDTFAQLLVAEMPLLIQPEEENRSILRIGFGDFLNLHAKLLASTVDERNKMKGMEPMRAEMITLASIFVKSVLDITKITSIIQTDYALKEGVIAELLSLG